MEVEHGRDGSVLDVGRKRRTIPPALRRALEVRDRGCRFPGCGLRFTDAHHVIHWADGGETSLENTLLLCWHHHRLVHEEGWRVEWWGEESVGVGGADARARASARARDGGGGTRARRKRAVFRDPRGGVHMDVGWSVAALTPAPDSARDPVEALVRANRRRGVDPDAWTAGARWKRERDVPDEVLFRALEATL